MEQRQDGNQPEGEAEPGEAGCEEGEASLRGQLLSAQGLHLELRLPAPDLGGPRPRRLVHQRQGRRRSHRRLRDR